MTTRLTADLHDAVDDALLTGTPLTPGDAFKIAELFGVWSDTPAETRQKIDQRYDHPTVGPTGRRALDALRAFLLALEAADGQTQP